MPRAFVTISASNAVFADVRSCTHRSCFLRILRSNIHGLLGADSEIRAIVITLNECAEHQVNENVLSPPFMQLIERQIFIMSTGAWKSRNPCMQPEQAEPKSVDPDGGQPKLNIVPSVFLLIRDLAQGLITRTEQSQRLWL